MASLLLFFIFLVVFLYVDEKGVNTRARRHLFLLSREVMYAAVADR